MDKFKHTLLRTGLTYNGLMNVRNHDFMGTRVTDSLNENSGLPKNPSSLHQAVLQPRGRRIRLPKGKTNLE